ncbi:lipopolysaccharide biosynthesis protein [Merismopedia glauca]|uniref:Teichoic acid transporter n=1 Tax=Merismopedia glauca CCAP 1448/3 TaxID=1296344 RepID=A0A2T1C733_9CYAN|nr:oligosaccharide flippase family protein [Merismopedia glauca]PSB04095.1 teichoic acid transporter [Merismopedia glauca CCAP 1448/3]
MRAFRSLNIQRRWEKITSLVHLSSFDKTTEDGRSKERYRRVFATTAASVASKGVSILTNLISVPLTVNYLGTERYGLWMTISSAIALLSFADLGMGSGLLNAIAEADGKDDRHSARVYVSSAFFILLAIAMLILVVFASIYPLIPWERVFNVRSDLAVRESGPTMAVLIASFAVNIPLGIAQRVQMGYQEGYKNQLWAIVGGLMGLAGLLLGVYFKVGLPWLVLAISGGPVLGMLINWIVLFGSSRKWLFPQWKYFNWLASRKILGTGTWFFILQILTVVGTASDNLIISQALGASAVASYAVTQKLFSTAFVSQFFITPLWPAFAEAIARADYNWARKTLNRSLIISSSIGIITALILFIFANKIITIWAGPNLVPSTLVLIGFTFWLILLGYIGTMSTLFNSGSLISKQVIFISAASIASLLMKIVLVHQWQAAGVIWATVFGYSIFYLIPAAKLATKTLKIT